MLNEIQVELQTKGYSLVPGARLLIDGVARDFETALANEWNNLEPDNYLKNGARFRKRRYGRFYYLPCDNTIRLLAHRPYFQSETANSYAGGIHRIVAPLTRSTVDNPLLKSLIGFNFTQFPMSAELLDQPWEVACHQFRIVGTADELGEPTPEGIHRDEIDFGAIHLISRSNAEGGYSRIYNNSKEMRAEFCLASRMDTLYWADRDVLHSVTPITAKDAERPAVRDILILGYKCSPSLCEID